jgi:hypothetical protein
MRLSEIVNLDWPFERKRGNRSWLCSLFTALNSNHFFLVHVAIAYQDVIEILGWHLVALQSGSEWCFLQTDESYAMTSLLVHEEIIGQVNSIDITKTFI